MLGGQAFLRLSGRRLRAADVAFVRYEQVEGDEFPGEPAYPELYPDLAVEVLSPSDTAEEMREKWADCFGAGTRLVWEIDPAAESAAVYTSVEEPDEELGRDGALDGRDVLRGFSVTVGAVLDAVRKRPAARGATRSPPAAGRPPRRSAPPRTRPRPAPARSTRTGRRGTTDP